MMNKSNNNKNKSIGNARPLSITVFDHPLRHRLGLSTLIKANEEDNRIEEGNLVSEVGPAENIEIATYCDAFKVFHLRKPRINRVPSFIFGSTIIGDTYSAFIPKMVNLPAVGSSITIDPWITEGQETIFKMYNFISANVTWIVHVPSPLGTGIYIKVYAPEIDATTETRGVRYKPSSNPTLAVTCPWSNDLSLIPTTKPRDGQSGGSIIIHTIEDNSIETLNTPLMATVWCCVHGVNMTGYALNRDTPIDYPALAAKLVTSTPTPSTSEVELLKWNADDEATNEVTAEGGAVASSVEDIGTPSNPLEPEPETETIQPILPHPKAAKSKHDTGHLGTKWIDYQVIALTSADVGVWKNLIIDPYKISTKGECFNLPWKRNVWTSGQRLDGVVHSVVVQFNIARSPQVSGVLLVKDSSQSSYQYLVQFGEKVEIPMIPIFFNGNIVTSGTRPRYYNNNWLRTDEAKGELLYKLISFNRTADIADVNVKVAIRPGYSMFQVPRKPKKRTPALMAEEYQSLIEEISRVEILQQNSDDLPEMRLGLSSTNPSSFITPFPALQGEAVTLHEELGDDECIELDEFPIQCFNGVLQKDVIMEIPINLPAITDTFTQDENAITQKFQRFGHIIPKSGGAYGPVVGNYTIKSRLPTGIAAEIQHVCLPGDMADQSMILLFGLDSIVNIAGGVLSSIGGPLINGIVNTVTPALSGAAHAIGGNAIGGLVDGVLGSASSILGGVLGGGQNTATQPTSVQPTAGEISQPTMNPGAISGDIPISRFVEFIKAIKSNYTSDPVLSTLLIQASNILNNSGESLESIPLQVLANMRNVKVERNLFNRSYDPSVEFVNSSLTVSIDRVPNVLEAFYHHPNTNVEGTVQNGWYKKFLSVLIMNLNANQALKSISMNEVRAVSQVDSFSAQNITDQLKEAMSAYRSRMSA